MEEIITTVKCFCSFSVTGAPDYCESMYEDHDCQDTEPSHWYDSVFSFYGVIVVLILAAAIVSIATNDPGIF